jgi:hypothetical protein
MCQMALLSNYPFLDQQEFRQICEAFVASFHERDAQQKCWGGLQLNAVVRPSSLGGM